MDKKIETILCTIVILAAVIGVIYFQQNNQILVPPIEVPSAGSITIQGILTCLPHKNTSGPQTLECAFGLKDTKGRYFGLRDSDPNYGNVGSTPFNILVEIQGTFTPEDGGNYQSIGVIEVTKITILDEINSFEECAAAGYPIMESYPEQCRTPDGRNFVREI